jgi:hypothetical protein
MGRKTSDSRMTYSNKTTMQIANMKFKLLISYPHSFPLKKNTKGKFECLKPSLIHKLIKN